MTKVFLQKWNLRRRIFIGSIGTLVVLISNLFFPREIQSSIPWPQFKIKSGCTALGKRPLRVGVSQWAGFTGGLLANGGMHSTPDAAKLWGNKYGVELVPLEDFTARQEAFSECADSGNHVDILWTTIDTWAAEYPLLKRNADSPDNIPRAFMQIAQSKEACAIIVRDRFKGQLADLQPGKLGAPKLSPAYALALRNVAGHSDVVVPTDTSDDALHAFRIGTLDAVALCEPFLHQLRKTETNVRKIDDPTPQVFILVARNEVFKAPGILEKFAKRWLEGNKDCHWNHSAALSFLAEQRGSGTEEGASDTTLDSELQEAQMSTPEDNQKMFDADYDAQFNAASNLWVAAGISPASPENSKIPDIIQHIAPFARAEDCINFKQAETNPYQHTVHFDSNSSDLKVSDGSWAVSIRQILRDNPRAQVCITGHTDNTGTEKTNKALSYKRAQAVANYLEVPPIRIVKFEKANREPIATNKTHDGRAQNRRAEIEVVVGVK
ncbi:MAG TPA: phosphate ABC transporter substrate-binding/OmpA family protein [Candidatus Angelobacter sp.]|nr:phosphate ABC transporter substrate-binding/OmpA family protein [Candidatus Angelobacter sp.]